ncbi:GNAT family N-acetyltransferase [Gemella sp. GH3]|uniref:GNAT family N-acetyltransferase n=1 Tax=unclassified Gemella TaxID=2624949 RepID=UPI0015D06D8D|nr:MULTISPECIES: GNAT family N-acetyltransferase [unclassified Gemella]MBF0714620.1 GNAT family N-acetyltransferase [Gemella sp. GH3.1]NYS51572.1 GNAT family N-acetyltransferase [Gemella sp. GH3]
MKIINLSKDDVEFIDDKLDKYDSMFIENKINGRVSIGIKDNGVLVAGLDACMTAFRICYISTVFVEENYRRKGYGTSLMKELERRAGGMGANTIRLDTFDFQGKDFYIALGYEQIGFYKNDDDKYSEYFFVKRI